MSAGKTADRWKEKKKSIQKRSKEHHFLMSWNQRVGSQSNGPVKKEENKWCSCIQEDFHNDFHFNKPGNQKSIQIHPWSRRKEAGKENMKWKESQQGNPEIPVTISQQKGRKSERKKKRPALPYSKHYESKEKAEVPNPDSGHVRKKEKTKAPGSRNLQEEMERNVQARQEPEHGTVKKVPDQNPIWKADFNKSGCS